MSKTNARWREIGDDLRFRLDRGEFDHRFPTDRELVEQYGVSRHTIREAIRGLQDEGTITRTRGRGSFRTPTSFAQPLGTIYSLFRSIEDRGSTQTSAVIRQEEVRDKSVAEILELPADSPLFFLERTRLVNGEPLAVDQAWLPLPLARSLLEANFSHTALYDELRSRCGVIPEKGVEECRPIVLDRLTGIRLGLSEGKPAFEIERRTFARDRPLEWRVTIVRGDRYAFRTEWNTPWDPAVSELVSSDTGGQ